MQDFRASKYQATDLRIVGGAGISSSYGNRLLELSVFSALDWRIAYSYLQATFSS